MLELAPTVDSAETAEVDGAHVRFRDWTGNRSISTIGTNAGSPALPFQRWRRFKEAFAPEIVERALRETSGAVHHIADPFGGSGTTALAAQFLGIRPTTIEVNPFLADLIEAKIATLDFDAATTAFGRVVERVARGCAPGRPLFPGAPPTFVEPGRDGRYIFSRAVAGRIACVYGQVLKTRRNNRVIRVERRLKVGTASRMKAALLASEDSETLNTSFVERLNLTIRQGSAYLRRRSPCHARGADQLRGHVELLRCYYNFIRPHRALRFGRKTRTPAMQAGLVSTRLNWSDVFTAPGHSLRILVAVVRIPVTVQLIETGTTELTTFSWPHEQRTAA